MLCSLHIENMAVIKSLDIDFNNGFSVLTGETGAGKSVIINSLVFLLGGKIQKDFIRTGEEKSEVSGYFTDISENTAKLLNQYGIENESDNSLLFCRTLNSAGKIITRINSKIVPSSVAIEIGNSLVDIHSQHDNQLLQKAANHIYYLDGYAGLSELLEKYSSVYTSMRDAMRILSKLTENEREKERKIELLNYQINDITSAALIDGEEEKLELDKTKIQNSKVIGKQVLTVYRALYKNPKGSSATQLITLAKDTLDEMNEIYPQATEHSDKLMDILAELESIAKTASEYMPQYSEHPETEIAQINERLDTIRRLKRKYGASIAEVLEFCRRSQSELDEIMSGEEKIKEYNLIIEELEKQARAISAQLHEKRKEASLRLSKDICDVLKYLDMEKVSFSVSVDKKIDADGKISYNPLGCDNVEFFISTNIGEPQKPLSKIASGGEMARIMLAVKCVLANSDNVSTIIFDEVDTGVSGKTSQKIGIKLHALSKSIQVICITHSAQIAAVCDSHYLIKKSEKDNRVESSVRLLDNDGRISELARIIGGVNITEKTLATAKEMLFTNN